MFSKSFVSFVLLAVLSGEAQARIRIVERDGRALWGRRFGQESPAVVGQIGSACRGEVCGVLGGKAIGTLLAGSPECAQQDLADDIIDASKNEDAATAAKMVELAITFRQAEKNTPPDFTTNPPTARNSVFCQTPPRNPELVGLNQAQDPANDPETFFDPACKCSVAKGSQANTAPLGGGAAGGGNAGNGGNNAGNGGNNAVVTATESAAASATETVAATETATATTTDAAATTTAAPDATNTCPAVATVTVTVDAAAPTATEVATSTDAAATATETAAATTTAAAAPVATGTPANVDLGSCSDPTIKFGVGIEGRKETSFIPNNLQEFNHGSAQNSGIITQFICDTFVNSCKANQAAKDLCAQAKAAAAAAGAKQGAAADAFNAAFGATTNFAAIPAIDSQGNPVA